MTRAPRLVLAWGNRSRGDDALGPLLLDALAPEVDPARVELLEAHQLQPEHALDLDGRERVLLVDADATAAAPFELRPVAPEPLRRPISHALSPAALLAVMRQLGLQPPPATLLALAAEGFELGAPPGPDAAARLAAARAWVRGWISG